MVYVRHANRFTVELVVFAAVQVINHVEHFLQEVFVMVRMG